MVSEGTQQIQGLTIPWGHNQTFFPTTTDTHKGRSTSASQNQQQKMFRLSLKPITFLKISEMYSLMSTNNPEDIFSTSIVMIQFAIYWEQ